MTSTLSWTPCSKSSPSNAMIFFRLAAFSVPTRASKRLAHWSSLNKTPNLTLIFPSASVRQRVWLGLALNHSITTLNIQFTFMYQNNIAPKQYRISIKSQKRAVWGSISLVWVNNVEHWAYSTVCQLIETKCAHKIIKQRKTNIWYKDLRFQNEQFCSYLSRTPHLKKPRDLRC